MSELRWNPVLEEWVITATERQDRTFLPPADYCPLCPTKPGGFPTEIPAPLYQVVAFENKFPSLRHSPPAPAVEPTSLYRVKPAYGECEVIVYTPEHRSTLADRSVDEIERLLYVWMDRYRELGAREGIEYVYIFENKGEVIGVTLSHPHGQIYAFPFIPPRIQKELDAAARHMNRTGKCLFCRIMEEERQDGRRIVIESDAFLAAVPFFARWPYEVHIWARRHVESLLELESSETRDLARVLKTLLQKYDRLWGFSMPYMMVLHQRPTDGRPHESYHFHLEFYPPHRTRDKLKFLAGVETGAGTFINDSLAEEKAAELRATEPARLIEAEVPL
jgi:UDPglucose--hexose-1-phosphate uridylyltransferase